MLKKMFYHLFNKIHRQARDYVWIGDNVFIKHGITIADYAVVGVNSVVTKDIKPFEIVAGVPAKHIRFNIEHNRYGE